MVYSVESGMGMPRSRSLLAMRSAAGTPSPIASSSFFLQENGFRRAHGEGVSLFEDDELLAECGEVVHAMGYHDYGQSHFLVQR